MPLCCFWKRSRCAWGSAYAPFPGLGPSLDGKTHHQLKTRPKKRELIPHTSASCRFRNETIRNFFAFQDIAYVRHSSLGDPSQEMAGKRAIEGILGDLLETVRTHSPSHFREQWSALWRVMRGPCGSSVSTRCVTGRPSHASTMSPSCTPALSSRRPGELY